MVFIRMSETLGTAKLIPLPTFLGLREVFVFEKGVVNAWVYFRVLHSSLNEVGASNRVVAWTRWCGRSQSLKLF